jgi:hypothetical protein
MDKDTRNYIQRATQAARGLLEDAFRERLEGTYDMLLDGTISEQSGGHLSDRQKVTREKLVAGVAHKRSSGLKAKEAVDAYLREAAFTTLNRFVALKMLEARSLVQECISKGEDSSGFKEFTALAPGLVAVEDKGYRLYIETLFDEIGQEVKVLFDRRDVASLLWPDRQTLLELLGILNAPELSSVWAEDETIGWVYQYFNGDEERDKMRKASRAPRNSRELAVRNQFFTPRYVVQFLTDNTVGRSWYEMMQGDTQLAHLDYLVRRPSEVFLAEGEPAPESDPNDNGDSELSQEELLQQTVHVPFRAKKDPRDLRILDPACGSGHFLLYTFDLLITIYEEAWADAGAAAFTETGTRLRADYESLEDLRRASPGLILRHNLHGVDIDPRAAQIAALALWMRAQRAYNQFDVDRDQRPPITKTNIVVAEPMPGDAELVDEFAASLKPAVLGDLFKKMVEEMKLAGELGSLLKIEESIAKAVKEAEEAHHKEGLFAEKIESQDFWDTADEKIIAALGSFAESAAGAGGVRRQLFAGDAAQGVAFIELMRKRFDALLMNPPFGEPTRLSKAYVSSAYPSSKANVLTAFAERASGIVNPGSFHGGVFSRTCFYLVRFEEFRRTLISARLSPMAFADLGKDVLDATVEVAAAVFRTSSERVAPFFRLLTSASKACSLRHELDQFRAGAQSDSTFLSGYSDFSKVSGCPFVYWVPAATLKRIGEHPTIEPETCEIRVGLQTGDDFRFLRTWWEVPTSLIVTAPQEPEHLLQRECIKQTASGKQWVWYSKIDAAAPFVAPFHLLVQWCRNGQEIKAYHVGNGHSYSKYVMSESKYFLPGISYMLRSSRLVPYAVPPGMIPSAGRSQVFPAPGKAEELLVLLASNLATAVARFRGENFGQPKFQNSMVASIPFPEGFLASKEFQLLKQIVGQVSEGYRTGLRSREDSIYFDVSPLTKKPTASPSLDRRSILGPTGDRLVATAFALTEEENSQLERDLLESISLSGSSNESSDNTKAQQSNDSEPLLSFLLGVAFGRYSTFAEPTSEGMSKLVLPLKASSPLCREHSVEPVSNKVGAQDILVDDPGHNDNVTAIVSSFTLGANDSLDVQGALRLISDRPTVRARIATTLFSFHIGQYTQSRRKAPIYWQLATPSASYSVWCYYHRLTRDTFFRVANDYVTPKVDHEERKLNTLRQEAGPDPSSKQRKEIDAQETFVAELRAFLTEVKRIAPLWNPNLNDGVIINFAPLWRLVPQHRAWQKECKKVWDKLVKGDYDWAHLAMHLWPERVVPKCQTDRSLAIAHGLEDEFWVEDDDGKWQNRQVNDDRVAELVAERSSSAVKAAVTDLLEAPTAAGPTRRKRRTRT